MFDRVIILCTGNICRSPMAWGLLRNAVQSRGLGMRVDSAGLAALSGEPPDPAAVRLLAERGIDIRSHIAKQASEKLLLAQSLILTMERAQREYVERTWPVLRGRVYRWGEWQGFDVPDPYGEDEAAFRDSLAAIDRGLTDWAKRMGLEAE